MNNKEFQDIYKCVFGDSEEWRRWFFDEVVDDSCCISISRDGAGKATGCLMMQPFGFLFHNALVRSEYMSCVATRPEARQHGVAGKLIADALRQARGRGSALCCLIPAEDRLYFFYDRFGFATTFYIDRERYTSLHTFPGGSVAEVEPTFELFSRLEKSFGCGVVHDRTCFCHAVADNRLEGGHIVAVRDPHDGAEAMLFAVVGERAAKVKCLLADNAAVADGALAVLRSRIGEKSVTVERPPLSGEKCFLRSFGMSRVLNPEPLLSAIASAHPGLNYSLRLTDPLLPENSGIYTLRDGECRRPCAYGGHIDLECSIDTFAAAIFSSEGIGNVLDLPSRRPYMALMLD